MIERLENSKIYNPIREHISMDFQTVSDKNEIFTELSKNLKQNRFDPDKSRVLIFVQTRRQAEEAVDNLRKALEDDNLPYAEKVDYYHAGLEGTEREEKYENYDSGELVILIATKAFGMGMDIKNIHFIYHLGPSSSFEDFLQEVGRAGRNKEMLDLAGYSNQRPIETKCYLTLDDFKKLKDKIHDSQITWNHILQVRETIFRYIKQFRSLKPDETNAFPLPLDLLDHDIDYDEINGKGTFFRVVLYWLEKLERVKVGLYTPTYLPVRIVGEQQKFTHVSSLKDRKKLVDFFEDLKDYKEEHFLDEEIMMIPMNTLKVLTKEEKTKSLFKILFNAQKAGLIRIERKVSLLPTKLRMQELESWSEGVSSPIIESVFDLAGQIMNSTKLGDQINFDGEFIDLLIKQIVRDHLTPSKIFWREEKNGKSKDFFSNEEIAKKLQKDFINKRSKFAFKLISFLPKMKHKSLIEIDSNTKKSQVNQMIYNGCKNHDEWKESFKKLKKDLTNLIYFSSDQFINENVKTQNIVDLLLHLNLQEHKEEYFQQLVFLASALGYLKGRGSLIPMGVELFVRDTSEILEKEQNSKDNKVFRDFVESNQMKELRLLALECLAKNESSEHDTFIKAYFKCATSVELISLLEEQFGEDHENLRAFRTEALDKAKSALSEEQHRVYDASLTSNIQVVAGPGSGKTHTLTLRVARLIQEEKVKPENILILAYNRAVVVELKERLTRLFRELGYSRLIQRLKVFTFHGFCKYCLSHEIQDIDFDQWTTRFINEVRSKPGVISQKIGTLKYVFVDEFQDITNERMELLELIANPQKTKVCVIGDPNQSIYGYERANVGDPMDPKPYYEKFSKIYSPEELNLSNNYRSYPDILTTSETLLALNQSKFEMPQLKALKTPNDSKQYCEVLIHSKENKVDWKEKLIGLLQEVRANGKKYGQVAIMCRSNPEVYRIFNIVQGLNLDNIRIRVQGSKASPYKSREFHYFICEFEKKLHTPLGKYYKEDFEQLKKEAKFNFPCWDEYLLNLIHCLILEFEREKEEDSTYADLIEFLKEVSSKDDGQFGKIYENHISTILPNYNKQEVVITTMHKVKGVEYDAVLIPPSFSNLPLRDMGENTQDLMEEERRLYYVAYTRAKYRLVVIKYKRELALDQSEEFAFDENAFIKIGPFISKEGIDKFDISWGATSYGKGSFGTIKNNVKIGNPVVVEKSIRKGFVFWEVFCGNKKIACLRSGAIPSTFHSHKLCGYNVSAVYVYTYNETVEYDKKHESTFASRWTDEAKERGYIYIIDFSGYGNSGN